VHKATWRLYKATGPLYTQLRADQSAQRLCYGLKDCGSIPGRDKKYLSSPYNHDRLWPTKPPIQCVSGALSLGVKLWGREADHSPTSSAEFKNGGTNIHSATCRQSKVLNYMIKYRENFTVYFYIMLKRDAAVFNGSVRAWHPLQSAVMWGNINGIMSSGYGLLSNLIGGSWSFRRMFPPWRWRQYISMKLQYPSIRLHGVTAH
jgi:hypothetical protein